jgi:hypothetical protein
MVKNVITIDLNKVPEVTDKDNPIIIHVIHRHGYKMTKSGVLQEKHGDLEPSTTIRFDREG